MRVLVAGIGNIFLGDDRFGVEVVRRLRDRPLGDGVEVVDYGIRGLHLAYALTDGRYDAAILVDAVPRAGEPGTLYVLEPDLGADPGEGLVADTHTLTPDAVLAWIRRIGAPLGRVFVVGCEPASVRESMELSAPVAASIDSAIATIRDLVAKLDGAMPCA